MIELNGIFFDKIRIAKVVQRDHVEYQYTMIGKFPKKYSQWFDVEINGEDLGLRLDKDKAEEWLKENIK